MTLPRTSFLMILPPYWSVVIASGRGGGRKTPETKGHRDSDRGFVVVDREHVRASSRIGHTDSEKGRLKFLFPAPTKEFRAGKTPESRKEIGFQSKLRI